MSRLAAHALALIVVPLLLAGCGFHLRSPQPLPFATLYVAAPETSEFAIQLKRQLRTLGSTRVVDRAPEAEATLSLVSESREKIILSVNAKGLVREFRLGQRVTLRLTDAKGNELMPAMPLQVSRDISFNDSQVLAKDQEEQLLFRDMQNDLIQQSLRRLAAVRTGAR